MARRFEDIVFGPYRMVNVGDDHAADEKLRRYILRFSGQMLHARGRREPLVCRSSRPEKQNEMVQWHVSKDGQPFGAWMFVAMRTESLDNGLWQARSEMVGCLPGGAYTPRYWDSVAEVATYLLRNPLSMVGGGTLHLTMWDFPTLSRGDNPEHQWLVNESLHLISTMEQSNFVVATQNRQHPKMGRVNYLKTIKARVRPPAFGDR